MANDLWRKTKELWREHERKKNLAELEWNLAPVGRYEEFFEKAIACYNHLIVRGKTEGLFYQMKLPKWSPRYQEWLETGPWYRGPWLSDLEKGLRQSEESLAKVRALHEGLCDPSNEGLNLREFLCRYRRYSPERGYYVEPQDNPGVDASIYWHFGKDTRNAIVPSVFSARRFRKETSRANTRRALPPPRSTEEIPLPSTARLTRICGRSSYRSSRRAGAAGAGVHGRRMRLSVLSPAGQLTST